MSYIWGPSGDTMRGDVRKVRRQHTHHPVTMNPACQGDLKQRHTYRVCVRVMVAWQTAKFHPREPLHRRRKGRKRMHSLHTQTSPCVYIWAPDSPPRRELCKCQRFQRFSRADGDLRARLHNLASRPAVDSFSLLRFF